MQLIKTCLVWNRLKVIRGEEGGLWWKEGEGTGQRTCINNPWAWTMVWELTVGVGCGMGEGGQRGKNWYNSNRIMIKMI